METKEVKIKIDVQGAPVVDHGYVQQGGKNVVALAVDLGSKYCEVDALSSEDCIPEIIISANERSLCLNPGANQDDLTIISFPEYGGWDVWVAQISKYVLAVCLIKED